MKRLAFSRPHVTAIGGVVGKSTLTLRAQGDQMTGEAKITGQGSGGAVSHLHKFDLKGKTDPEE